MQMVNSDHELQEIGLETITYVLSKNETQLEMDRTGTDVRCLRAVGCGWKRGTTNEAREADSGCCEVQAGSSRWTLETDLQRGSR